MIEQVAEKLCYQRYGNIWGQTTPDIRNSFLREADGILNLFKAEYPIRYKEEADEIGAFIRRGWISPEHLKMMLDKLIVIEPICEKNSHQLQELLKYSQGGNEDVVLYWCNKCGSVQIDIESDGRFIRTAQAYKPQVQLQADKDKLLDLMGE